MRHQTDSTPTPGSALQWSVVVPAYMPGANLDIAVDSVLQAFDGRSDFEAVVVDDASPEPLQLATSSPHVRLMRMATNVGAVPNFNRAIGEAQGEFIHVLHADDYIEPGFYSALEVGLRQPGVVAAACGVHRVDAAGDLIETMKFELDEPGIWHRAFERLAVANRLPAVSIVAKRSTYDEVGVFDESLVHAADWDMWIRFSQAGDFFYDPAPLASYRVHEAQHTASVAQSGVNIDEAIQVIHRLPERVGAGDAPRLMADAFFYRAVYAVRTARRAIGTRSWQAAAAQYKAAARCGALGIAATLRRLRS